MIKFQIPDSRFQKENNTSLRDQEYFIENLFLEFEIWNLESTQP